MIKLLFEGNNHSILSSKVFNPVGNFALLFPEIERPKKREKKGETDRQTDTDNKKQNGKRLKRRNKMMKELEE